MATNATVLAPSAVPTDEPRDPLSFALARLIIESDPAARALPRFSVELCTFDLDEAVRALTGHLCNTEYTEAPK
jgi:hypothetical protein